MNPNSGIENSDADLVPIKDLKPHKESKQQPVWHVIVLCALTCMSYLIYWFYKNWRDLADEAEIRLDQEPDLAPFKNISPLLRTIALVSPIAFVTLPPIVRCALAPVLIYLMLSQFKGIAKLHPDKHSFPRRHPIIAATALVFAMWFFVSVPLFLSGPWILVSFLIGVPLGIAQHWLNTYYRMVEEPDLTVRHAFTFKELVAIIIGGSLLGLIMTGFFLKL